MQIRFLGSLALLAYVHAGDDGSAEASSADSSSSIEAASDRLLTIPASPSSYPYSPNCDWYTDCYSCLSNPSCLWDPNTITYGTCKPATECDFTYQPRNLVLKAAVAAPPPATACVRSASQCNQHNFNGAPLNQNPQRGIGCTNHGQCGPNQYCFSCAKCVGNCGGCNAGVPASGMCGPAYRCPIDGDSISGTCPGSNYPVAPPSYSSCKYHSCSSCTAAYGCVWSGSSCYYSTVPCSGYGCANTPDQCSYNPYPPYYASSTSSTSYSSSYSSPSASSYSNSYSSPSYYNPWG